MERRRRSVAAWIAAWGVAWSLTAAGTPGQALRLPSVPGDHVVVVPGDLGPSITARAADLGFTAQHLLLEDGPSGSASHGPRAVTRYAQFAHGFPIDDHGLRIVRDTRQGSERVTGVAWRGPVPVPHVLVDGTKAASRAADRLGIDVEELSASGALSVSAAWRLTSTGLRLVQRVEGRVGLLPVRVDVDAGDGRVLEVRELTSHGGPWPDPPVPAVGRGRGLSYRNVDAALESRERPAALRGLLLEDSHGGSLQAGTLSGAALQVTGADGWSPQVLDRRFLFGDESAAPQGPWVPEFQLFDQVNTYAWATRAVARTGWQPVGVHRVWVNWDGGNGSGFANAFFAPADPDGTGALQSGYLVFGEWSGVTGVPAHDASRDPSVVAHEVAHLALHGLGFHGGLAPVDSPPRALNEGFADAFAALWLRDPVVGRVLAHHGATLGVTSRDLSEARTLPAHLWDTTGAITGLPSEHNVGRIVGSALWRLGGTLGRRRAIDLMFEAAPLLPSSPAELGFEVITPGNAEAATRLACSRSLHTLRELARSQAPHRGDHVLGAALAHGLLTEEHARVELNGTRQRAMIPGAFLPGTEEQVIIVALAAGQEVDLRFTRRDGRTLTLAWEPGPEGELPDVTGDPQLDASGTRMRWRGCRAKADGLYRLVLGGETGDWRLSLRATPG